MSITPLRSEVAPFPRQDVPTATVKRLALVGIKALVSIGLIAILATRLDYARVLSFWRALDGDWILGAIGILFLEMGLLAGVRLQFMLASVDARRPVTTTARIALCGFFFEQVTIGFVGGDAIRLWLLRRRHAVGWPSRRYFAIVLRLLASPVLLSPLGVQALLPQGKRAFATSSSSLGAFIAAGLLGGGRPCATKLWRTKPSVCGAACL
jgi:uncharacterized membrane protein YbhN (UPF0104 family)